MKQILLFSVLFYSVLISRLTPVHETHSTFKFTYPKSDTFPNTDAISNDETILEIPVLRAPIAFIPPIKDTLNNPATPYPGAITIRPQDVAAGTPIIYMTDGLKWKPLVANTQGGVADTLFVADNVYVTFDEQGRQILKSSKITTVANLRSVTNPQVGLIYMSTDMGGGIWLWNPSSTAADNTGTVLETAAGDTGRLERQYSGALNCLWFNIKGDSVTDNLAAFINLFNAMGEGHSFYLPAGMYMVSCNESLGDIVIPSYTHLFGEGMGVSTIKFIDACSAGITATANVMMTTNLGTNITVERITFDGNMQNQTWLWNASANYGIGVRSSFTTIKDCEMVNVTGNGTGMAVANELVHDIIFDHIISHDNGKKGIHSGVSRNIKIVNSSFYNLPEDGGIGLHQGAHNVMIANCYFENCRTAINIGNSATHPYSWMFNVSNCQFKNNFTHMSIGNSFGNIVDSFHKETVIENNTFDGGRIHILLADNVKFTNNILAHSSVEIINSFNIDFSNNNVSLKDTANFLTYYYPELVAEFAPFPSAIIEVSGGAVGTTTLRKSNNVILRNNIIDMDTAFMDYGILYKEATYGRVINNQIIGTAKINTIYYKDNAGTATIEQLSTPDMRIEDIFYTEGFSNAKEFTTDGSSADGVNDLPVKAVKMSKFWNSSMLQMQYAVVGAVLDADGEVVTPPVWSNPGAITYTNGTGALFKNNATGIRTTALTLENDFSADQSAVSLDFDVANSELTTGRINHRTNVSDGSRDFLFDIYTGSSLVNGMTLLGASRVLQLATGLTAATSVTSPLYLGSSASGGNLTLGSTSHATKGKIYFGSTLTSWFDGTNFQWGFNVGAGTTNANDKVVIANTSSGASMVGLRLENNLSVASTAISIDFDVASSLTTTGRIKHLMDASTTERHLSFETYNGSTLAEKLRITGLGNVGVNVTAPTSALHTTAFATAYRAISALRTLDATDHTIECTSGTFTVTLPTSVGITGREYWITNTGSGTITIGTTSSQVFSNVTATPTTLTVAQFTNYKVKSNGTGWLAYKIVN